MNKIEVAEYLKLSIASINRFMKNDDLPYSKMGKSVRFKKEQIDEWFDKKNPLIAVGKAVGEVVSKW